MDIFQKSFTQQEPIPASGISRAVEVMLSGRLHRYNTIAEEPSETAMLEEAFANYLGTKYCLACASGGYALSTALRAFGVRQGEPVLTNAFTLSPVPGAIATSGGQAILVETTENLVMDLADLERKLLATSARLVLISHMRGHLIDMDALCAVLARHGASLIEDCAHTMGASWDGKPSGTFGIAACFSTQTYKHINSGEGGLLVSNEPALMAKAILLSGSYMLYERHTKGPAAQTYADLRFTTPNCSGRMDDLRAAILIPQLAELDERVQRWNARYQALAAELESASGLYLPARPAKERFVGSSLQFLIRGIRDQQASAFVARCKNQGVELKWFGAPEPQGYTSTHFSWKYLDAQTLPQTDQVLHELFDLRIPLTFTLEDCRLIGRIIRQAIEAITDQ
ncbi:aminotransferase class I/II-fold pyridoxal phosphate-dependent enzyme [uncultured Castellaniella sp.]|uniref:DegT/DnrJ/EryC1/StrS family aminotransferase n=1 Tax=uncultured Castellaniella sp. TaxID=647907 RepID=UPI00260DB566|nr:aminotransferase class I/II-fold pyridoxal phosphate-dependent enzyme [uncultured Castellaniella sp.]